MGNRGKLWESKGNCGKRMAGRGKGNERDIMGNWVEWREKSGKIKKNCL